MADDGDQIALSPRLDAEDAEAILIIVERHPFHKTGESFRRALGLSQACFRQLQLEERLPSRPLKISNVCGPVAQTSTPIMRYPAQNR